ncbi:voltage-gated inwardly rectifying potassium channel KCNH7-like [Amphiura filiformis]|uniref:voltage-gated inwardly rectifying potassium channel KCNH7-like n=1 Tax=Amphiura filiformis TaxID=82378 RepID=UPI003B20FBB4
MLSVVMKPAFFLPNQLIIDHNDITTSMYYVHRGELEVLDPKYQRDTVNILRSGELFGEVHLVKTLPRFHNVRAGTHCDLMMLDRADLNSVLVHYPGAHQYLTTVADTRLIKGEEMEALKKAETRMSFTVIQLDDPDDDSASTATSAEVAGGRLARFRKWVADCIKDLRQFDWYFVSNGKVVKYWEYMILSLTTLVCILYPYAASFTGKIRRDQPHITLRMYCLVFFCDAVMILDIFFRLRIAPVTPNGTNRDFKTIRANYIQSRAFVFDLLAALPLQIFAVQYPVAQCALAMSMCWY